MAAWGTYGFSFLTGSADVPDRISAAAKSDSIAYDTGSLNRNRGYRQCRGQFVHAGGRLRCQHRAEDSSRHWPRSHGGLLGSDKFRPCLLHVAITKETAATRDGTRSRARISYARARAIRAHTGLHARAKQRVFRNATRLRHIAKPIFCERLGQLVATRLPLVFFALPRGGARHESWSARAGEAFVDEEEAECCDPAQDAVDVIRETLATTLRAISPTKGLILGLTSRHGSIRWRFPGECGPWYNNTISVSPPSLSLARAHRKVVPQFFRLRRPTIHDELRHHRHMSGKNNGFSAK